MSLAASKSTLEGWMGTSAKSTLNNTDFAGF
jgi:hypothetical protein